MSDLLSIKAAKNGKKQQALGICNIFTLFHPPLSNKFKGQHLEKLSTNPYKLAEMDKRD